MKPLIAFILLACTATFAQTTITNGTGFCHVYQHGPYVAPTMTCYAQTQDGGSISLTNVSAGIFGPNPLLPGWQVLIEKFDSMGGLQWSQPLTGTYANGTIQGTFPTGTTTQTIVMV